MTMALTKVDGGDGLKKPADFADNEKARFGTGQDLEIYHDGTDTFLSNDQGDLVLRTVSPGDDVILRAHDDVIIQTGGSDNAIICNNDADVSLYYNTNKKLETKSDGVDITGELQCDSLDVDGNGDVAGTLTTNRLVVSDNGSSSPIVSIRTDDASPWAFALGNDSYAADDSVGLRIYQDTSGEVSIRNSGNSAWEGIRFQQQNGGTTNTAIHIDTNRSVNLKHQDSTKLSTRSDGVNVIGELECDSLDVDGNVSINNGSDTTVTLQGTNDVLLQLNADTDDNGESGNPEIKFTQDGSEHVLSIGVNGTAGQEYTGAVANHAYIKVADGHVGTLGLDLATNNTRRLTLNNNGHLYPATTNTYDLGKSNAKFANVYSENFVGSGGLQSVQVFTANGTWTKPSGVTKVRVTVTGGGGGGGAGTQSWNTGQGGGAGGTAIEVIDVSSVSSVSVTVGSGGAGATGHTQNSGSANGSNGGTSSFGSYCSATGGSGGDEGWGDFQDLGNGGSGSGGNINLNGGDAVSKGGGNADDQATASLGGASYWGGGGKGGGRGNDGLGDANNGQAYGSGGGGGAAGDGSYHDGHQGKGGIVYVEEFA